MKTLLIIGNGFDLSHGLHTSYEDFHLWLENHGYSNFAKRLATLYPDIMNKSNKEWHDIEKAMGSFTMEDVTAFDENYNDGAQYKDETSKETHIVGANIKNATIVLPHMLMEWIKSINYSNIIPRKIFSRILKDIDYILSFNYTLTLEKIYSLPQERIFHIHGSILEKNKELVIGYLPTDDSNERLPSSINPTTADEIRHNLMTNMIKPIKYCINTLHDKFTSDLKDVDKVIVFGHSCSNIDKPYFIEISKMIDENAKWIFYYHDPSSVGYYDRFAKDVLKQSGRDKQHFELIQDNSLT